jgi:integrase
MQSGKIYIKNNSWWFRFMTPIVVGGQKRWKDKYEKLAPSAQFASAKQVEKEFGSRIRELLGETASITTGTMQPINDFIEKVYFPGKHGVLRPSTLAGYKDFYKRHLKPLFEDRRLCDMKLPLAQQMIDNVARKNPHVSAGLLKHLKWLGVAIFDYAAQQGAFNPESKNPFSNVAIPRTQHVPKPSRYATLDDVVAMINALDAPAATVVAVAAFSGLRKSEIQGLRWDDLKGDELRVQRSAWRPTHVIEETKTLASKAPVPVIPILAKYLEAHRNGCASDGFIFTGAKMGKPLDLHNLANRVIRPALKEANTPWCGWHGFRRGLATSLYELGVDGKTRQSILRHANISMTENVYTKPVSKISKAAMAKVEKAFNAKLKIARNEAVATKKKASRKRG